MDNTNLEIEDLETEMKKIRESASLFEVNVPEFRPLKQCRKEIKMLKVQKKCRSSDVVGDRNLIF